MLALLVGLLAIFVLSMLVWAAVNPRGQWWALSAWRFEDPAANEPSDSAFTVSRVVSVLTLVALVCLAIWFIASWPDPDQERRDETARHREEYRSCLRAEREARSAAPYVPGAPQISTTPEPPSMEPPEAVCKFFSPTSDAT